MKKTLLISVVFISKLYGMQTAPAQERDERVERIALEIGGSYGLTISNFIDEARAWRKDQAQIQAQCEEIKELAKKTNDLIKHPSERAIAGRDLVESYYGFSDWPYLFSKKEESKCSNKQSDNIAQIKRLKALIESLK